MKLLPGRINGYVALDDGEYDCVRTDVRAKVVSIEFENVGTSAVNIQYGGGVKNLQTGDVWNVTAPFGYYDTTIYRYTFANKSASATRLTISTITTNEG